MRAEGGARGVHNPVTKLSGEDWKVRKNPVQLCSFSPHPLTRLLGFPVNEPHEVVGGGVAPVGW